MIIYGISDITIEANMEALLTQVEKSARNIKRLIISGQYAMNISLPQRKIAREMGVSHIVIREAFRVLEKEGLLTIIPKWGARVTSLDLDKMREISVVREALEGMAARLLAERIVPELLEQLRTRAEATDKLFKDVTADRSKTAEAHYAFHIRLAQLTGCQELSQTLERLNVQWLLWWISNMVDPSQCTSWHGEIVEVIGTRDSDKAEAHMRRHVRCGFEEIESIIKNHKGN